MPDPLAQLARDQRDKGSVLHPSMTDYDGAMARTWGGPMPRWYKVAEEDWPRKFSDSAGRIALVTGGSGGIGFYVAKLLYVQHARSLQSISIFSTALRSIWSCHGIADGL